MVYCFQVSLSGSIYAPKAWPEYQRALTKALAAIKQHGAQMLIVSLGLDTYEHDPVQAGPSRLFVRSVPVYPYRHGITGWLRVAHSVPVYPYRHDITGCLLIVYRCTPTRSPRQCRAFP